MMEQLYRMSASPHTALAIHRMALDTDVSGILATVSVPVVVIHRRGDRWVPSHLGRALAEGIPNARYVECPGEDHFLMPLDVIGDEIERMVTGREPVSDPERGPGHRVVHRHRIVDATRGRIGRPRMERSVGPS